MKLKISLYRLAALSYGLFCSQAQAAALPAGFVHLKDVDPSIIQEMRYVGYHNFIGHPIQGYEKGTCILTRKAAEALKQVQTELRKSSLSLKVYDCYRPQQAVNEFYAWSQDSRQQSMKAEFYPLVNKADVFNLGYILAKSGHTRGSTVDLTIIPLPAPAQEVYHRGQKLLACYAPYYARFKDNSLDMGTGFDCLDETAHQDYTGLKPLAEQNRLLLSTVMQKYGFKPYVKEWWHFTLKDEPFPQTYFNFPVK